MIRSRTKAEYRKEELLRNLKHEQKLENIEAENSVSGLSLSQKITALETDNGGGDK